MGGACYNIPTLNKHYHVIQNYIRFSCSSLIIAIHEMSHSYIENKYNVNTAYNIYREVIPIFNEFKAMDNFINFDNCATDVIRNWMYTLRNIKLCLNTNFRTIFKVYDDRYFYIIGILISFYFYELDKTDTEKCQYLLDYFCSNLNNYSPIELLQKTDIDIEQLTSGEIMKRMIKKYDENYKKIKS